MSTERANPRDSQEPVGGVVEHRDRIVHQPGEADQRDREPATHRLGIEQRDRLRHQLTEHDVQRSDDGEGDRHRYAVGRYRGQRGGQSAEQPLQQECQARLADPAESQGGEGDPQLGGGDVPVEGLDDPEGQRSFAVALPGALLQPGFAGANEGELGCDEIAVGQDQGEDGGNAPGNRRRRCGGIHNGEG